MSKTTTTAIRRLKGKSTVTVVFTFPDGTTHTVGGGYRAEKFDHGVVCQSPEGWWFSALCPNRENAQHVADTLPQRNKEITTVEIVDIPPLPEGEVPTGRTYGAKVHTLVTDDGREYQIAKMRTKESFFLPIYHYRLMNSSSSWWKGSEPWSSELHSDDCGHTDTLANAKRCLNDRTEEV